MTKSTGTTEYVTGTAEYRADQDRTWARVTFLRAIQGHAKEVLAALREQVLPAYRPHHPRSPEALEELRRDYRRQGQVMDKIRPEVVSWADQFDLRGPRQPRSEEQPDPLSLFGWMENIVACTLIEWQVDPKRPLEWGFLPQHSAYADLECPRPFLFETDGWALQRETDAAFMERVRAQLEIRFEEYINQRRRQAKGLVPVPSRLASNHFAYLALYQCLRRSQSQIAQHFQCERNGVSEGIRRAAKVVIGDEYKNWLRPPLPAGKPRSKGGK